VTFIAVGTPCEDTGDGAITGTSTVIALGGDRIRFRSAVAVSTPDRAIFAVAGASGENHHHAVTAVTLSRNTAAKYLRSFMMVKVKGYNPKQGNQFRVLIAEPAES
jgi:hypothetical protein